MRNAVDIFHFQIVDQDLEGGNERVSREHLAGCKVTCLEHDDPEDGSNVFF